jgi:hypothetical protein
MGEAEAVRERDPGRGFPAPGTADEMDLLLLQGQDSLHAVPPLSDRSYPSAPVAAERLNLG